MTRGEQPTLFGPLSSPPPAEEPDALKRTANITPCGRYRPALSRAWAPAPKREVLFVGLNPSTADGLVDDPTIRRCIRFAGDWGFDGLWMGNLFAYRATDPAALPDNETAVGRTNDDWLRWMRRRCALCVVAWGAHPAAARRVDAVLELLGDVHALGVTRDGHPRHPLYLRADARPIPWTLEAAA